MSEPSKERDDPRTIGVVVSGKMRSAIEDLIPFEYQTISEYVRSVVRDDLKRRGKLREEPEREPAEVAP